MPASRDGNRMDEGGTLTTERQGRPTAWTNEPMPEAKTEDFDRLYREHKKAEADHKKRE